MGGSSADAHPFASATYMFDAKRQRGAAGHAADALSVVAKAGEGEKKGAKEKSVSFLRRRAPWWRFQLPPVGALYGWRADAGRDSFIAPTRLKPLSVRENMRKWEIFSEPATLTKSLRMFFRRAARRWAV